MTQHHIIGSEVGGRRPPAYLKSIGRRRARPVWLYVAAAPIGVCLFAIDNAIGFPVSVLGVLIAGGVYLFRPERK